MKTQRWNKPKGWQEALHSRPSKPLNSLNQDKAIENIKLVLLVVGGSFLLGSLPFIYGPGWLQPSDLQVRPTQAGLWQELGNKD